MANRFRFGSSYEPRIFKVGRVDQNRPLLFRKVHIFSYYFPYIILDDCQKRLTGGCHQKCNKSSDIFVVDLEQSSGRTWSIDAP